MLNQHLVNISSATNQVSDLATIPLWRAVHLVEREEKEENEVYYEPDGDGEEEENFEDDVKGQNYVVRKIMLTAGG